MRIKAIFQCPIGQTSNQKINANAEILLQNNQILYLYLKPESLNGQNFNCHDTIKQEITLFEYNSIKEISLNKIQQVTLNLPYSIRDYKITLMNAHP